LSVVVTNNHSKVNQSHDDGNVDENEI